MQKLTLKKSQGALAPFLSQSFFSGILVLVFLLSGLNAIADKNKNDSLINLINSGQKHDTVKLKAIVKLCNNLTGDDPQMVFKYAEQGLRIATKINKPSKTADIYIALGTTFKNQDKLDTAESCHLYALSIFKNENFAKGISRAYNNLGIVEKQRGNFTKSLEYYFLSIENLNKEKDREDIARAYTNIGIVYRNLKNFDKAIEYQQMCISIYSELKDTLKAAKAMSNLGIALKEQKKYSEAKQIVLKALDYTVRKSGSKQSIGQLYETLGEIYFIEKDFKTAEEYYQKSIAIGNDLGAVDLIVDSYYYLSKSLLSQNKFNEAKICIDSAYSVTKGIKPGKLQLQVYAAYAGYYAATNDYKQAYSYSEKYKSLNDSVFSSDLSKQISDMEKKLQNEKKQKEIELLKKNESIKNLELKRQKIITYGVGVFALIVIGLSLFTYKNLRDKKKAYSLLEQKNHEIAGQKLIIEEKNKDIIDSIKYAERLQKTILPPLKFINELIPNSFVFFKPKDIVSGDFYWIEKTKEGVLFAVIDCTGHGVPGAMMSLVGNNLLNKIVKEKGITAPRNILNELLQELFIALRQNADDIKANDGMDLTICLFNQQTNLLTYAGAFNPVLIARENELLELKTDKFSVGKHSYEHNFKYTDHTLQLKKNDVVYLSTDGYYDQFGGERGKKLMRKNFYKLLQQISQFNKEDQIKKIEETFMLWKGNYDQLDDITIFGFKV